MKFIAVAVLIVCYAFIARSVLAQDCGSIPECAASIAGNKAKQREFERATAIALQATADVRATDAAYNRMIQRTATAISVEATQAARPTRTPQPSVTATNTATPQPSPTSVARSTPQPVQTIVIQATPVPAVQPNYGQAGAIALLGVLTIGGLIVLYRLVVGRSYTEPNERK